MGLNHVKICQDLDLEKWRDVTDTKIRALESKGIYYEVLVSDANSHIL